MLHFSHIGIVAVEISFIQLALYDSLYSLHLKKDSPLLKIKYQCFTLFKYKTQLNFFTNGIG